MKRLTTTAPFPAICRRCGKTAYEDGVLRFYSRLTSSVLSIVEVSRAARRRGPGLEIWAHLLFEYVETIEIDDGILRLAASLEPPQVRSMDAVQLASALRVSAFDLDFIAYDKRILQAAARAGLRTLPPI